MERKEAEAASFPENFSIAPTHKSPLHCCLLNNEPQIRRRIVNEITCSVCIGYFMGHVGKQVTSNNFIYKIINDFEQF